LRADLYEFNLLKSNGFFFHLTDIWAPWRCTWMV